MSLMARLSKTKTRMAINMLVGIGIKKVRAFTPEMMLYRVRSTIHPSENRVFSVREVMLMMSVPAEFKWAEIPKV